jgi:hypothetical protein
MTPRRPVCPAPGPLEANTEPVVGAQKPRAQSLQWFLSESTWDPDAVTQRRLELLRADPLTYRYGSSEILVLINITDGHQGVKLNVPARRDYTEMLRFRECELGEDEVALGPYAGIWLEKSGVRVPA